MNQEQLIEIVWPPVGVPKKLSNFTFYAKTMSNVHHMEHLYKK